MNESLVKILNNLLDARTKNVDAPCSSDHHWCVAIAELILLIPEYKTDDPEFISEIEYAQQIYKLLHGQLSMQA
jgi:hypothetical protein